MSVPWCDPYHTEMDTDTELLPLAMVTQVFGGNAYSSPRWASIRDLTSAGSPLIDLRWEVETNLLPVAGNVYSLVMKKGLQASAVAGIKRCSRASLLSALIEGHGDLPRGHGLCNKCKTIARILDKETIMDALIGDDDMFMSPWHAAKQFLSPEDYILDMVDEMPVLRQESLTTWIASNDWSVCLAYVVEVSYPEGWVQIHTLDGSRVKLAFSIGGHDLDTIESDTLMFFSVAWNSELNPLAASRPEAFLGDEDDADMKDPDDPSGIVTGYCFLNDAKLIRAGLLRPSHCYDLPRSNCRRCAVLGLHRADWRQQ